MPGASSRHVRAEIISQARMIPQVACAGTPGRHCNPASREITRTNMGWHDTAQYGAGGALSGAERTGKDNGAAIYWVTFKLYTVRGHISLFYVYV